MNAESTVSRAEDGKYVVRFFNGVGVPLEYRCQTVSGARTLMEELGLEAAEKPRRPGRRAYAVELSAAAREELAPLSKRERTRITTALGRLAVQAARLPPPSRAMLVAAGVNPPVLRGREGRHVLVYEADGARLSVLHVLDVD
jgi:mRNA-degrading endonuclease RelE of RelBE toxin-antitoxin system